MIDETAIREHLHAGRQHEAFELIVARFQLKVFHLALSFTHNETAASDLAQDALLRVWKALPSYRADASLSTWIYTISRNVCFTELTRARRRATFSLDAPESQGTLDDLTAPDTTEAGATMDVESLLSRLPDKYQRVLRLFYLEDKSYEETGDLLGLPVGTVKSFLFRARKELGRLAVEHSPAAEPAMD
ncbi:MAG TPA: sigma-70 family RNA polymerase sigma factor [Candidatus Limnocylindria bacterium]|nr:sigma-70 family RNA polymerase sigma factor [Candidatus Limnocylindria bacterium]